MSIQGCVPTTRGTQKIGQTAQARGNGMRLFSGRSRGHRHSPDRGFTLIELLVVVAIVGILAAMGVASFQAYRQKSLITKGTTIATSVRTALLMNAITTPHATFPSQENLSNWQQLRNLCSLNGSPLSENAGRMSFQNWTDYTPIDRDGDSAAEDFCLLLRMAGVPRDVSGAQFEIRAGQILKQTY